MHFYLDWWISDMVFHDQTLYHPFSCGSEADKHTLESAWATSTGQGPRVWNFPALVLSLSEE